MDKLKREHALALDEVKKLQCEYTTAVLEVQELSRQYNKILEDDVFTLVAKRSRSKKYIKKNIKKARKRKIMENDPFKPKPSLFGLHPWGDYESD